MEKRTKIILAVTGVAGLGIFLYLRYRNSSNSQQYTYTDTNETTTQSGNSLLEKTCRFEYQMSAHTIPENQFIQMCVQSISSGNFGDFPH